MSWLRRIDRAGNGAWLDAALYGLSGLFAWWTAAASTLAPHRAWGAIAAWGYLVAFLITAGPAVLRRPLNPPWRALLAAATWAATCLLPLLTLAAARARAGGGTHSAQEEVLVIEDGGRRLLESGTPYLSRDAIAQLPDQLLGYLPYQPGMAIFGLPRGLDEPAASAWSDARIWFALATAGAMFGGLYLLRRAAPFAWVRAMQAVAVLPVAALTLATGGDDLPVLALCLLGFALAVRGRPGWSGLAMGAAAALKLFAWPVALVLGVYYATVGWPALRRYLAGAVLLPVLTMVPALLVDPSALVENVIAYPFGHGLVTSPAASPLPGRLIATSLPGGDTIAKILLGAAVVVIVALLWRRPPRSVGAASAFAGWSLLAAMLLLPSTRFGYLLYPAVLLLWVPALTSIRAPSGDHPPVAEPVASGAD